MDNKQMLELARKMKDLGAVEFETGPDNYLKVRFSEGKVGRNKPVEPIPESKLSEMSAEEYNKTLFYSAGV
jgi:hypothetical protein